MKRVSPIPQRAQAKGGRLPMKPKLKALLCLLGEPARLGPSSFVEGLGVRAKGALEGGNKKENA